MAKLGGEFYRQALSLAQEANGFDHREFQGKTVAIKDELVNTPDHKLSDPADKRYIVPHPVLISIDGTGGFRLVPDGDFTSVERPSNPVNLKGEMDGVLEIANEEVLLLESVILSSKRVEPRGSYRFRRHHKLES
jgi:hypothetical protein